MPGASPLILCVDDESVGLHVRRMLLERAGYRVLTALDGETGLQLFTSQPVEAVVLDFSMPGLSGGEVAKRMRGVKPAVPILMLSAYTSLPPDVVEVVDLSMTKGEGAPALLTKLNLMMSRCADSPAKGGGEPGTTPLNHTATGPTGDEPAETAHNGSHNDFRERR